MAELYRLKRFDIFVTCMSYMLYVALNIAVFLWKIKFIFQALFTDICLTQFCLILFLHSQNEFISEYEPTFPTHEGEFDH